MDQIHAANSELVGLYVQDLNGTQLSIEQVSSAMDGYGWQGAGYRILDNATRDIWNGGNATGAKLISGTPQIWVVDTATMKIVHRSALADNAFQVVNSMK